MLDFRHVDEGVVLLDVLDGLRVVFSGTFHLEVETVHFVDLILAFAAGNVEALFEGLGHTYSQIKIHFIIKNSLKESSDYIHLKDLGSKLIRTHCELSWFLRKEKSYFSKSKSNPSIQCNVDSNSL